MPRLSQLGWSHQAPCTGADGAQVGGVGWGNGRLRGYYQPQEVCGKNSLLVREMVYTLLSQHDRFAFSFFVNIYSLGRWMIGWRNMSSNFVYAAYF
mmetsp:Transcript_20149/g.38242  ORF Transcript_20149/g.38242 Transcript_20149/m.38242 type:complete len:96 (-) Transcript_20149:104-391(-)